MWGRRGRAPGVSLTEEDDGAPAECGAGGCVLVVYWRSELAVLWEAVALGAVLEI